ncbi:MAG: hypothetical protein ACYTHJ_18995 [Planctomycetota bacterium]|jgi:hypothetical protein
MNYSFDPFIIRRMAEGRLFFVNPRMPFEYFIDCFQSENPFFMVAHLPDGRLAITPNWNVIPQNLLQAGHGPWNLFPTDIEYVTLKGTYPIIITAHPVANAEEWLLKFERFVVGFAKQPLSDFVASNFDYIPLKMPKKVGEQFETRFETPQTVRETVNQ